MKKIYWFLVVVLTLTLAVFGAEAVEVNGGEVTDGASFSGALGGAEYAAWSWDETAGVYTVTLNADVEPKYMIDIKSGSYVLNGTGTVSRASGYTGTVIRVAEGSSLTLGGSVAVDGGAVWTGADTPAAGATNSGITAAGPLVQVDGTLALTGGAVLRNQEYDHGALRGSGSFSMTGGGIRNCKGYCAAADAEYMNFDMSGGEISGCLGARAVVYARHVTVSGGTVANNGKTEAGCGVFFEPYEMEVSGGAFTDNGCAAVVGCGNTQYVIVRGGTFTRNNPAIRVADGNYNDTVKLSGAPVFSTETDLIRGKAEVTGALTSPGTILLQPDSYVLGTVAVCGDAELVSASVGSFRLYGGDAGLVINSAGRIDTDPTSLVTDGDSFVRALGGTGYASASRDSETGVWTVTLLRDAAPRSRVLFIESGSYVLDGTGTVSRASGYTGTLIQVAKGSSLTLGGSVAVDGGAVWTGADTPAAGASNTGIAATGPLVQVDGTLALTGGAVLRNQENADYYAAVQGSGSFSIGGGAVRNCKGYYAAVSGPDLDFGMSGGEISGCFANHAVVYARHVTVSGGTVANNKMKRADDGGVFFEPYEMEVSGGSFTDNEGAVVVGCGNTQYVTVRGGTFTRNNPAVRVVPTIYNETVKLSGAPVFSTETDLVRGKAEVAGALSSPGTILLQPDSYALGTVAVYGDAELVSASVGSFRLYGGDADLVINSAGKVDTDPTSLVTDGDSFVRALGGTGYASASRDSETGTWTVTLLRDAAPRTRDLFIESGNYVLNGTGTVSRASGYTGTLIRVTEGSSLTLGGSVIVDGGAVWTGADTPAAGASNTGIAATGPLVQVDGTLALTGGAVLRNQENADYYAAVQGSGSFSIGGGAVRNCKGYYAAVSGPNLDFGMSGGEISGCFANLAVVYARHVTVSGGTVANNKMTNVNDGGVFFEPYEMEISGGTFTDNDGAAVVGCGNTQYVTVRGGTFTRNNPAVRVVPTIYNETVKLSGAPVFSTETDLIRGKAEVAGALTSPGTILLQPDSYANGAVAAVGTDAYGITASDFACFGLAGDAPDGAQLRLAQAENRILVSYMTPVLIETAAERSIFYDGEPVAEGEDFSVSVFLYEDGEKGDEITSRYTVGGGDTGVSFCYREAGSTGEYTDGLPAAAGDYTVVVTTAADNELFRAAGSASFDLSILPLPILAEASAAETPVVYDGEPVERGTDFTVRVFLSEDGEKGDEITGDYTGEEAFRFRYRPENQAGEWTDGLPAEAGTYVVLVTVIPDRTRSRGGAETSFALTIIPLRTVSFLPGGGTGTMEPVTVADGSDCELPENRFVREGFHFTGWKAGTAAYADKAVIPAVRTDLALTAQWEEDVSFISLDTYDKANDENVAGGRIRYTLTCRAGDESWSMDGTAVGATNLSSSGAGTLELEAIPDEGYVFIGWFAGETRDPGAQTLLPTNELVSESPVCGREITGHRSWHPFCAVFAEIRNLDLPSSLTSIGAEAFAGTRATVAEIPGGCGSIGDRAFAGSSISLVSIPPACELGDGVFDGCGAVILVSARDSFARTYCDSHDNCLFREAD